MRISYRTCQLIKKLAILIYDTAFVVVFILALIHLDKIFELSTLITAPTTPY